MAEIYAYILMTAHFRQVTATTTTAVSYVQFPAERTTLFRVEAGRSVLYGQKALRGVP